MAAFCQSDLLQIANRRLMAEMEFIGFSVEKVTKLHSPQPCSLPTLSLDHLRQQTSNHLILTHPHITHRCREPRVQGSADPSKLLTRAVVSRYGSGRPCPWLLNKRRTDDTSLIMIASHIQGLSLYHTDKHIHRSLSLSPFTRLQRRVLFTKKRRNHTNVIGFGT